MLDWKNEAVESLKRYRALECALFCLPSDIEEVKYDIKKTQRAVADGLPDNSIKDIQLSRRIMLHELEYRLKRIQKTVEEIKQAISALTEEERTILTDFFISNTGKRMEDIAQNLGYSLATMYRKKDSALWNYAVNLYEIDMEE